MKKKYMPRDTDQKFGYLIEECGEVLVEDFGRSDQLTIAIGKTLAAVGKTLRWGLDSVNPDLPVKDQEENGDWVLRELKWLKRTIKPLVGGLDNDSKLKVELQDLKRAIKLVEQDLKERFW